MGVSHGACEIRLVHLAGLIGEGLEIQPVVGLDHQLQRLLDRRCAVEVIDTTLGALRRGGYLFGLAFLFRLQLWLFGLPGSPWTDLLKVDILNCMGFAIGIMSVMAIFTTAERVRLCAVLGVAIAIASPLVSALDWKWLPAPIANYLVPNYQYFAFFPWASFIAFGLSIGSLLRLAKPEDVYADVGRGAIRADEVLQAVYPQLKRDPNRKRPSYIEPNSKGVSIAGLTEGIGYRLGACCHPIPGRSSSAASRRCRSSTGAGASRPSSCCNNRTPRRWWRTRH